MAIFRTAAILVPNGDSSDNTTFDSTKENQKVRNYWGNNKQNIFKITNAKLEQLFQKAKKQHEEVALKVKNIENPLKVSAQWVVFDAQKASKTANYYVLDEKMYDDKGEPMEVDIDGEQVEVNSFKMFAYDYVCAVIGSSVNNGTTQYNIYFHPGRFVFEYIRQPTIGPGGAGGGAEIPPGH
jgi:hypothetical protein